MLKFYLDYYVMKNDWIWAKLLYLDKLTKRELQPAASDFKYTPTSPWY